MNEEGIDVFGDCPWHQDILDCRACAEHLGVDFQVVDFIKEYREQIVEYLVEGYRLGRTPNPDVMCNRRMKFGKFLDYAKSRGFSLRAIIAISAKIPTVRGIWQWEQTRERTSRIFFA